MFAAAGCQGLARVDFFVDGEEVLVNELNTMPGFTPTSVYAKLIDAAGIQYAELVERLCRLARRAPPAPGRAAPLRAAELARYRNSDTSEIAPTGARGGGP